MQGSPQTLLLCFTSHLMTSEINWYTQHIFVTWSNCKEIRRDSVSSLGHPLENFNSSSHQKVSFVSIPPEFIRLQDHLGSQQLKLIPSRSPGGLLGMRRVLGVAFRGRPGYCGISCRRCWEGQPWVLGNRVLWTGSRGQGMRLNTDW